MEMANKYKSNSKYHNTVAEKKVNMLFFFKDYLNFVFTFKIILK